MSIASIRNVVSSRLGRQMLTVRGHAPALLFGAGVVGVVTAAVLASRATLKLDSVLEEHKETLERLNDAAERVEGYTEKDHHHDKTVLFVKTTGSIAKLYLPAVGIGIVSICALTGSHVILTRRNVALTAAYAALNEGFQKYRDRVVAEYGKDKDLQYRYDLQDKEIVEEGEKGPEIIIGKTPGIEGQSIYAVWFDEGNRNWDKKSWQNQFFISCQQNWANEQLNAYGYLFLNDVYKMLGIDPTPAGQIVGWLKDGNGDGKVDFGVFANDPQAGTRFVSGDSRSILLDFNVDGPIWNKFSKKR